MGSNSELCTPAPLSAVRPREQLEQ